MRPITYGRKSSKRHSELTYNDQSTDAAYRPRKRPKTKVEIVNPISQDNVSDNEVSSQQGSRASNRVAPDTDTDEPSPSPARHHAQTPPFDNVLPIHTPKKAPKVTYLSRTPTHPSRLNTPPNTPKSAPKGLTSQSTLPSSPSMDSVDLFTPQKPAKDLSSLFDFSQNQSPSKSASKTMIGDGGGMGGTTGSGSGVAKRMLSRSRTESSFDSPSRSQGSSRSVTSLSSHSHSSFAPKNYTTPSSRSPSPSKILAPPPPPVPIPIPSTSTSTTTTHARTYAGKSRSFLISLPASSFPSGPGLPVEGDPDPLAQVQTQEDSETRESYTDLRTRWGVDNSEDDPYPPPNNSPSSSPSIPPSRSQSPTKHSHSTKGKGKEKEQITYPNGLANDLKSITELRSKGESRRFLDEVGYLFEGMEPSGRVGVRRASALEIVTKLCSPDFARKAKATDFHSRAWGVFLHSLHLGPRPSSPNDKDKILSVTLACFSALVASDFNSLVELAQMQMPDDVDANEGTTGLGFVGTLVGLLDGGVGEREKDILGLVGSGAGDAELKRAGIGRTEKPLLTTLYNTISKNSGLFSPKTHISTRLLLSHTLSVVPPAFLLPHHLPTIMHTLRSDLHLVRLRILAYISGLSLFPPSPTSFSDTPSFEHIENCLRLLDSFLLSQWASPTGEESESAQMGKEALDKDREHGLAKELVAVGVVSELMTRSPNSDIAIKCTKITFRVLLSFTQDDANWCQALLKDELTLPFIMRTIMKSHAQRCSALSNRRVTEMTLGAETETDAHVLDHLCLALGLLTDLVQISDTAKDLTRQTHLDPACSGKRACIQACQCPQRVSALDCLAQVYIQQFKGNKEVDPDADFLRGHIAVLLGLLMRDDRANQKVLLAALPGFSNRNKLASLAEQAREFVTFYAELAVRLSAAAAAKDKYDEEEDDLAPRSDGHNGERIGRDGNGHVAREVVSFLEKLTVQQS